MTKNPSEPTALLTHSTVRESARSPASGTARIPALTLTPSPKTNATLAPLPRFHSHSNRFLRYENSLLRKYFLNRLQSRSL